MKQAWLRTLRFVSVGLSIGGLGLAQSTWYVDDDGTPPGSGTQVDPYTSLAYALDQPTTLDGDTLLVAEGTYHESIDPRGKRVTIDGRDARVPPIFDARGNGSVLVFRSGEGPDTVVRGLHLTGGFAWREGGGVRVEGASPVLENLLVTGNRATRGGGVGVVDGGAPRFLDCRIEENVAEVGGGCFDEEGHSRFDGCTIDRNEASLSGGALRGTYERCSFTGNRTEGDAAVSNVTARDTWIRDNVNLQKGGGGAQYSVLEDCIVIGNRAESAAGVYGSELVGGAVLYNIASGEVAGYGAGLYHCKARDVWIHGNAALGGTEGNPSRGGGALSCALERCRITGNEADLGAGVCFEQFTGIALDSCTVTGNRSRAAGGGLWFPGYPGPVVRSTILWGNLPNSVASPKPDAATVRYSCVEGDWPGKGNFDRDPRLFGPAGSDLHLLATSPCIDRGSPKSPRDPDGSLADVGAHAFDPTWAGGAGTFCSPRPAEACLPLAHAVGAPNASGTEPFELVATQLPPERLVVLFAAAKHAPTPRPNGLCLAGPTQALAVLRTTGAPGACDGVARHALGASDWSALGVGPGDRIYFQFVLRDAGSGTLATTPGIEVRLLP